MISAHPTLPKLAHAAHPKGAYGMHLKQESYATNHNQGSHVTHFVQTGSHARL